MSQTSRPNQPPIRLVDIAASAVFWVSALTTAICAGICVLICAVFAPFDPRRRIAREVSLFWIRASIAPLRLLRLWRIEVVGKEHHRPDFRGVYAPNHASQMDILVLHAVGLRATWVSKTAVFWMPFIGWIMLVSGYIGLRRNDAGSIRSMTRNVEAWLKRGTPVVIFPEGTRSKDGSLLPFKVGAFQIARRAGVDVQPIAVEGTGRALAPKSLLVRGALTIRVTFLPQIPVARIEENGPDAVAQEARSQISAIIAANEVASPPTMQGLKQDN